MARASSTLPLTMQRSARALAAGPQRNQAASMAGGVSDSVTPPAILSFVCDFTARVFFLFYYQGI
jgi:hypothetical protein